MLLDRALSGSDRSHVVVTPNVAHVVRLHRDQSLLRTYQRADYMFADGMPIVLAARLLGQPVPGRVTGADLFRSLCADLALAGARAFVLGGHQGEEEIIISRLSQEFPGLVVRVFSPSMDFNWQGPEAAEAIEHIKHFQPSVTFVCLGFPKQEYFAINRAHELPPTLVLCVGAALDFMLGREKRAPLVFRGSGLEWLWRLANNPRRLWRRYLLDAPAFVALLSRALLDKALHQRRAVK
jgi:N-acetylglucosaminyldiphosphoundecaprenol N-acetyl-beta-D-mannosaminyltransferase